MAGTARAAREIRVKSIAVWHVLVHHNVILSHSGPVNALLFTCHQIRERLTRPVRREAGLPVREALLNKLRRFHIRRSHLLTITLGP
jgi:hypothetical protein